MDKLLMRLEMMLRYLSASDDGALTVYLESQRDTLLKIYEGRPYVLCTYYIPSALMALIRCRGAIILTERWDSAQAPVCSGHLRMTGFPAAPVLTACVSFSYRVGDPSKACGDRSGAVPMQRRGRTVQSAAQKV